MGMVTKCSNVYNLELQLISGRKWQRQYFVKYKSCAHVHNCWVPEQHLLPSLVAKFNRKNQVVYFSWEMLDELLLL